MPNSANAPQPPPAGRCVVDPANSTVTFVTRHMFGLGTVRGRFVLSQGSVVVAERAEDSSAFDITAHTTKA